VSDLEPPDIFEGSPLPIYPCLMSVWAHNHEVYQDEGGYRKDELKASKEKSIAVLHFGAEFFEYYFIDY